MSLLYPGKPREGCRYRFKNQVFYAVEGGVAIEDQRDGSYRVLRLSEVRKRIVAMYEEAQVMSYKSERDEFNEAVRNLREAFDEAVMQGNPFDPYIAKYKAKAQRRILTTRSCPNNVLHRRRSRSVTYFGVRGNLTTTGSSVDVSRLPLAPAIMRDTRAYILHTDRFKNFNI